MLSTVGITLVIVPILIGLVIWNTLFGPCMFDTALFGVGISLVPWTMMIWNNFSDDKTYASLAIIGFFFCFNTFITLWFHRSIHRNKYRLCM